MAPWKLGKWQTPSTRSGDRLQIELDRGEEGERAFRSHQEMRHVVAGIVDHVDVVAADPAQQLGEARCDLVGLAAVKRAHAPHQVAIALRPDRIIEIAADGTEMRRRAIRQDRVDGVHVVHHVAVAQRARAATVVGGHAADGGAAAVEISTGKNRPCGLSCRLSRSSTTPGSTRTRRPRCRAPAPTSCICCNRRRAPRSTVWPHCEVPPPRGSTGTPSVARDRERGLDVGLVARHDDAQRLDLIDRGIGRLAPAGEGVEHDLALEARH